MHDETVLSKYIVKLVFPVVRGNLCKEWLKVIGISRTCRVSTYNVSVFFLFLRNTTELGIKPGTLHGILNIADEIKCVSILHITYVVIIYIFFMYVATCANINIHLCVSQRYKKQYNVSCFRSVVFKILIIRYSMVNVQCYIIDFTSNVHNTYR